MHLPEVLCKRLLWEELAVDPNPLADVDQVRGREQPRPETSLAEDALRESGGRALPLSPRDVDRVEGPQVDPECGAVSQHLWEHSRPLPSSPEHDQAAQALHGFVKSARLFAPPLRSRLPRHCSRMAVHSFRPSMISTRGFLRADKSRIRAATRSGAERTGETHNPAADAVVADAHNR